MFSMVTTRSSRLDISMLDIEESLLRFACWEILRLPGLFGLLRTFPPPENWVRTPGVERDLGRDMFSVLETITGEYSPAEIPGEDMRK